MADSNCNNTFVRYCTFQRGNERGFALHTHHAEIMQALIDRGRCEPMTAMGRGALFAFPILPGKGILREYRRGGVMQRFVREGTLTNRPLREWHVLDRLYYANFPVPEPLGVVWQRRRFLYTGAIATRYVDAINLADYVNGTTKPSASVLERIGGLMRTMHDLCVYHADLHVGNVLVAPGPATGEQIFFVDFDNARIAAVSQIDRARNVLRLRRSFLKHGLRMTDFDRILQGYGSIAVPGWLEMAYDIKGAVSDSIARRSGPNAV